QTESVCAGALGIRLAGPASYFGSMVEKPYIGDDLREVNPEDIKRANGLMLAASVLCECVCLLILIVLL
ncbi:MAG: cobalamin biosynthesis protein, partial [Lachnospiraceae bacterium]|nr:cobalamin biosynthesis protein [Lachnospiraceae bacterium]